MQIVDLLEPEANGRGDMVTPRCQHARIPGLALHHTCLRLDGLADADAALAFARARSCNWGASAAARSSGRSAALNNGAHAFVRVVCVDKQKGTLSLLHVVDLAGAQHECICDAAASSWLSRV